MTDSYAAQADEQLTMAGKATSAEARSACLNAAAVFATKSELVRREQSAAVSGEVRVADI